MQQELQVAQEREQEQIHGKGVWKGFETVCLCMQQNRIYLPTPWQVPARPAL